MSTIPTSMRTSDYDALSVVNYKEEPSFYAFQQHNDSNNSSSPFVLQNPLPFSTILANVYTYCNNSHTFFIAFNAVLIAAVIMLIAQFGTLRSRRTALYRISIPIIVGLLLAKQYYFAWICLLGVLHTCAHHFWPFINLAGLNIKASAFPDIVVHLTMHATVHTHSESSLHISSFTSQVSSFILLGCIWNCYLSSYSRVNAPWFVTTSIFQALSSGSWVAYLIAIGSKFQGGIVFELALWSFWVGGAVNWFLFKRSTYWLKKLFAISYLDTLFLIPAFLFVYNNSV